MLNNVVPVLKVVTVREAGNLGIFLKETFTLISYWRSNVQVRASVRGDPCHQEVWIGELDRLHTSSYVSSIGVPLVLVTYPKGPS